MRRSLIISGCVAALSLLTAACGGDDEASKDDYVDAMSGRESDDPWTAEEARCVSGAIVDVVSVETLNENDVLDKISDNPDGSLADYGIEMSQAQRDELAPQLGDCMDVEAAMVSELSSDPSIGPELAECIGEEIDPELWEQLLVAGIATSEEQVGADEVLTQMQTAAQNCATAGVAP